MLHWITWKLSLALCWFSNLTTLFLSVFFPPFSSILVSDLTHTHSFLSHLCGPLFNVRAWALFCAGLFQLFAVLRALCSGNDYILLIYHSPLATFDHLLNRLENVFSIQVLPYPLGSSGLDEFHIYTSLKWFLTRFISGTFN